MGAPEAAEPGRACPFDREPPPEPVHRRGDLAADFNREVEHDHVHDYVRAPPRALLGRAAKSANEVGAA
jgi:hypothetical protein